MLNLLRKLRFATRWAKVPSTVLWTIIMEIAILLAVISMDPFMINTNADKISREAFWRLASPLYPTTARNQILVVTLSDDDLPLWPDDTASRSWPISFQDQRDLLEVILNHNPKAVFLDFYFDNYHNDDTSLPYFTELLEQEANLSSQRLFLATLPSDIRVSGEITKQRRPVIKEIVETGIPLLMAGWEEQILQYPLYVSQEDTKPMPTAAYGLAQQIYGPLNNNEALAPVSMIWGLSPTNRALKERPDACFQAGETRWEQLATSASILWKDLFGGQDEINEGVLQPCPFHKQIGARDLVKKQAELGNIITDQIILVGGNIEGIHDVVISPVHGALPGVFVHAMALDNILSFQEDYFKEPPVVLFGILSVTDIIEILFIILVVGSFLLLKRGAEIEGISLWQRFKYQVTLNTFWLACILAVLFVTTYSFAIVPLNWIGLLAILLIVSIPSPEGIVTFLKALTTKQK